MNHYIKDWDWQQYNAAQVELNECTKQHKSFRMVFSPRWMETLGKAVVQYCSVAKAQQSAFPKHSKELAQVRVSVAGTALENYARNKLGRSKTTADRLRNVDLHAAHAERCRQWLFQMVARQAELPAFPTFESDAQAQGSKQQPSKPT